MVYLRSCGLPVVTPAVVTADPAVWNALAESTSPSGYSSTWVGQMAIAVFVSNLYFFFRTSIKSVCCQEPHQSLKQFFLSDCREKFTNLSSIGLWSSNQLEFLQYLFLLSKYGFFRISGFFTVHGNFTNNICQFCTVHIKDPTLTQNRWIFFVILYHS